MSVSWYVLEWPTRLLHSKKGRVVCGDKRQRMDKKASPPQEYTNRKGIWNWLPIDKESSTHLDQGNEDHEQRGRTTRIVVCVVLPVPLLRKHLHGNHVNHSAAIKRKEREMVMTGVPKEEQVATYLSKNGGCWNRMWKSFSDVISRSRWWTAHLKLRDRLPLICNERERGTMG